MRKTSENLLLILYYQLNYSIYKQTLHYITRQNCFFSNLQISCYCFVSHSHVNTVVEQNNERTWNDNVRKIEHNLVIKPILCICTCVWTCMWETIKGQNDYSMIACCYCCTNLIRVKVRYICRAICLFWFSSNGLVLNVSVCLKSSIRFYFCGVKKTLIMLSRSCKQSNDSFKVTN